MSAKIIGRALVLVALVSTSAAATTLSGEFDGRHYEVVIANTITWDAARAAAEARTHAGIQGQLATINSPEEDAFIHALRQQAIDSPHPAITGTELWIGGFQVSCITTEPEPGCGWLWINGEAISSDNTDSPYTNWQSGEPNNLIRTPDAHNRASEDHLAIGLGGNFGWNDEGHLPNIWGYVVEYGDKVSVPASTCTADGPGCNPTGGQIVTFPESATVADDAVYTVRTWRINDDAARCGVAQLTLFDGAVVIPKYLCGHPDFLVIRTESPGVEILEGTVFVENQTDVVLPGNLYGCENIRQNPAGKIDPDPAHRDVVAWQATDKTRMLETALGSGLGRFEGTVAEVTSGCGSSRGRTKGASYYFVGLRINAGPGNDYSANALGNHHSFVALTRYKLTLLQEAVVESKPALKKVTYAVLKSLIDTTIRLHDRGNYKAALLTTRLFLHVVENVNYKPIPGENHNGEHLMRGTNIEFMYSKKIIPFAP